MDKAQKTTQGTSGGPKQEPGIHETTNEKTRPKTSKSDSTRPKGGQGRSTAPGKGKAKPGAKIAANFGGNKSGGSPDRRASGGGANKHKIPQDNGRAVLKDSVQSSKKGAPPRNTGVKQGLSTGFHEELSRGVKEGGQKGSPHRYNERGQRGNPTLAVGRPNGPHDEGSVRQGKGGKNSRPNSRSPLPNQCNRSRQPLVEKNSPIPAKSKESGAKRLVIKQRSPDSDRKNDVKKTVTGGSKTDNRLAGEEEIEKPAIAPIPVDTPTRDGPTGAVGGTCEEDDLQRMGIFKLQKRKTKFPRAKYFCRLCNYHMDDLQACEEHAAQTRHIRLMKNKVVADNFKEVPDLSRDHLAALSRAIEGVAEEVGLTDDMMKERKAVMERVNFVIQQGMPDCQVELYGSSVSGFGFKTSDVNLNLKTTGKRTAAEMLVTAHSILVKKKKQFTSIGCLFEDKFPVIYFTDVKSKLYCELGTGSDAAVATSHLLLRYRNLDPRARHLVVAFRRWARLLEIDRPKEGSVPPYVFSLMVIYFLQRCDVPVLPVLQENEPPTHRNVQSLGALWVALFHFYLVKRNLEEEVICIKNRVVPTRKDLNIQSRRIIVDDPCTPSKKSITKYLSSAEVFNYIMDCLHIGLEYFSAFNNGTFRSPSASVQKTTLPDKALMHTNHIHERFSHETDPDPSDSLDEENSLLNGLENLELASPKDNGSSSDENKTESKEPSNQHESEKMHADSPGVEKSLSDVNDIGETDSNRRMEDSVSDEGICGNNSELTDSDELNMDIARTEESDVITQSETVIDGENNEIDSSPVMHSSDEFDFTFEAEKLSGGQKVPKFCSNCQQEGHVSKDCEEGMLPELRPLPKMQPSYMSKIQQLCDYVSDYFSPKRQEFQERSYVVSDLEQFIQHHSEAKIKLSLFGSSVNGFGFQNSDLDICMTFINNDTGECLNVPEVIQTLAQILRKHPQLFQVIPITTAKVPIVKFTHRPTQLEGDISLYNLLAQRNTKLLYTYSLIDRRVCRLGHMVKAFAKECGIADASRGSLSSYAYILMTIYFLQQTTPPVVPVLQELYSGSVQPERIVEGRNTWFFENVNQLGSVWKGLGKNKLTEAELFLAFLCFYTEKFDFDKNVVCIRQHKALTRFEKMWMGTNKGFTIEDPFDLDHNLGGALSRRMCNYIMIIFRQGRERYGTPQKIHSKYYEFFFDYDYLTDGQPPPNDRGCKICGKIGHYIKDCPVKLRGKERKKAKAAANTPQKKSDQQPEQSSPRIQKPTASNSAERDSENTKDKPTGATNKSDQPAAKQRDSSNGQETDKGRVVPGAEGNKSTPTSNVNNNQRISQDDGQAEETESEPMDVSPEEENGVDSTPVEPEEDSSQASVSPDRETTTEERNGSIEEEVVEGVPRNEPLPKEKVTSPSHSKANPSQYSTENVKEREVADIKSSEMGTPQKLPQSGPELPSLGQTPTTGNSSHERQTSTVSAITPQKMSPSRGMSPHRRTPPRHRSSPPRPHRTPNMPHFGHPSRGVQSPNGESIQQAGHFVNSPQYPHSGQSPRGQGQRMPSHHGYPPGHSMHLTGMTHQNMQQMGQGLLRLHPDVMPPQQQAPRQRIVPHPDLIHSGQQMLSQEQAHRQGIFPSPNTIYQGRRGMPSPEPAQRQGILPHPDLMQPSPVMDHSGQVVSPREQMVPIHRQTDSPQRQFMSPQREGMTPPDVTRMDMGLMINPSHHPASPPRHGTPPMHRATPPRHGATPPHPAGTPPGPMLQSPVMTPQGHVNPPLMSIPLFSYGSPPVASSPRHTQAQRVMVPQSPLAHHGYPSSPQDTGQMVYPSHPGASPIMVGQPMYHPYPTVGQSPQPLMSQQLPLMHLNGDMHLGRATVDLQQMLGMNVSPVAGPHPHPEMGFLSNVQGGPS